MTASQKEAGAGEGGVPKLGDDASLQLLELLQPPPRIHQLHVQVAAARRRGGREDGGRVVAGRQAQA